MKTNPQAWEENKYSKMFIVIDEIMSVMLNDDVCNHEDIPCPRTIKTFHDKESPWPGLAGLDIWWRPARSEIQKAQDKVIRTFMRACKIGYKGDFVEFARAYRAGLEGLDPVLQDRIIYSFLAAAHFERGDRPTLARHVVAYQEGLTKAQLKYEDFIDLWLQGFSKQQTFSTFIRGRQ